MTQIFSIQSYDFAHLNHKSFYLYKPENLADNWEDLPRTKQKTYCSLYAKLIKQKLQLNRSKVQNFNIREKKLNHHHSKKLIKSKEKNSFNIKNRIRNLDKKCDFLKLNINLSSCCNSLPFLTFNSMVHVVPIFADLGTHDYRILYLNGYNSYNEKVLNFKFKTPRI